jgi:hypothetical protein
LRLAEEEAAAAAAAAAGSSEGGIGLSLPADALHAASATPPRAGSIAPGSARRASRAGSASGDAGVPTGMVDIFTPALPPSAAALGAAHARARSGSAVSVGEPLGPEPGSGGAAASLPGVAVGGVVVPLTRRASASHEGLLRLRAMDALPPAAGSADFEAWKAHKAAALAAVMGHLSAFGGVQTTQPDGDAVSYSAANVPAAGAPPAVAGGRVVPSALRGGAAADGLGAPGDGPAPQAATSPGPGGDAKMRGAASKHKAFFGVMVDIG